jgi:hypothetical protein
MSSVEASRARTAFLRLDAVDPRLLAPERALACRGAQSSNRPLRGMILLAILDATSRLANDGASQLQLARSITTSAQASIWLAQVIALITR